jgi:hypothetical protein
LQHDGNGTVQEVTKGKLALFKGTQAFMMPRGKAISKRAQPWTNFSFLSNLYFNFIKPFIDDN